MRAKVYNAKAEKVEQSNNDRIVLHPKLCTTTERPEEKISNYGVKYFAFFPRSHLEMFFLAP
jgi:hypothetical protein